MRLIADTYQRVPTQNPIAEVQPYKWVLTWMLLLLG